MPQLPRLTAVELLRALHRDGWQVVRQRGSHVHLAHPVKSGHVTVPQHTAKTLHPKVLTSVLNQAQITVDELRALL